MTRLQALVTVAPDRSAAEALRRFWRGRDYRPCDICGCSVFDVGPDGFLDCAACGRPGEAADMKPDRQTIEADRFILYCHAGRARLLGITEARQNHAAAGGTKFVGSAATVAATAAPADASSGVDLDAIRARNHALAERARATRRKR